MDIALQDILAFPLMRAAVLRTAPQGARARVRWVSVIEMPVDDFVREDEFVLTTAMGCDRPELLDRLVCDVADSKAAALGIATGYYLSEIPQRLLALAKERALPLVEIPWEVRFSEITRAVSDALRKEEFGTLEAAQQIQTDVLDLVLRGGSPTDVAQAVSGRLSMPSLIVDARGEVLGRGGAFVALEAAFQARAAELPHRPAQPVLSEVTREGHRLLQYPIGSTQGVDGYLVLLGSASTHPSGFGRRELQMIEHASTACAFWFLHQHAVRDAEMRMRADFIWSLAKGQVSHEEALARGERLGYRLERAHICIVGHPDTAPAEADGLTTLPDPGERVRAAVSDALARSAEALGLRLMMSYQRETFLVYLEAEPQEALQPAHRLLDRTERHLAEAMPRLVLSWGIASQDPGPAAFASGYKGALEALDIGYHQSGVGHRTAAREVRLYQTLLRVARDPEVESLVQELLGPLTAYDERKGGELVATLVTFIRSRGQISETARLLNLHRQSLVYRISKIESLTGRSLSEPENWFLFGFVLRVAALRAAPPQQSAD